MKSISFLPLTEENKDTISAHLAEKDRSLREEIEYIKEGLLSSELEDVEYALALCGECLAVRVFDMGRYLFPYPFALSDTADIDSAIESIVYYAIKEELPIVFTDVPAGELSRFALLGYKNMSVKLEGACSAGEEASCRVRLLTECTELEDIPSLSQGGIAITALAPEDMADYAHICKDTDGVSLWGYDYREDMPNAKDDDFYQAAIAELDAGTALTLGIREGGALIGELIFYAFDGKGGADFAFRLAREHRGRGIGGTLPPLIFKYAGLIGLDCLMADVKAENIISRRILGRAMTELSSCDNIVRYKISL